MAARAGAQMVFLGQGIGPMTDPDLLRTSRRILARAGLIALRERLLGPRLLTKLAIPNARWMVTGDEAIELAYRMRSPEPGRAIGVHVRRAPLAPVEAEAFRAIGRVLHRFATEHDTELLPIPISQHSSGTNDARTIAELLREQGLESDGGRALDTPAAVIAQVAYCRVVVTGAYHAAVFALSQGIPVICLGGSEYYLNKFSGLIDLFPSGCQVVRFDDPELSRHLTEAMDSAWRCSDASRADLQLAAARQIEWGLQAYERVRSLVDEAPISRPVPAGMGADI
jgi:colanic acid/amylovoran biosynthesis protein